MFRSQNKRNDIAKYLYSDPGSGTDETHASLSLGALSAHAACFPASCCRDTHRQKVRNHTIMCPEQS